MIDYAKMIPPEVWQELVNQVYLITGIDIADDEACAAIAAALAAWPGATAKQANEHVALFNMEPALILPLPLAQEKPND